MKLPRLLLAIFAVVLVFAPLAQAASQSVTLETTGFVPATVTIYENDLVTWTNNTDVPDSATDDNQAWDTGTIAAGLSKSIKFLSAGTYTYSNSTGSLTGTVVVTAATASATPTASPSAGIGGDATSSSQPVSGVSGPTLMFLFAGSTLIIVGLLFAKKAHQLA